MFVLRPGDEPRVERLLRAHRDSSVFLRSNLRAVGISYEGKPLQGTWVAEAEPGGELLGVVCHVQNGNLLFQAPAHAAQLAQFARAQSGRPVAGLVGPWEQLRSARTALGLDGVKAPLESLEPLFALPLSQLVVPGGSFECRRVEPRDVEAAVAQRAAFLVEALGAEASPATTARAREAIDAQRAEGRTFVLEVGGRIVASATFNAALPDCVQLGGVFTPREERSRGHARRLVAGMLRIARAEGVTRAVLFTNDDNVPAIRAYTALGFQRVGDYGLILWSP